MAAIVIAALALVAGAFAAQDALVFGARAGVVLNLVKADSVEEFEAAVADLRRALETSDNPVRAQQAGGWHIFKAEEPGPGGSVIFVFLVDPVLPGADYSARAIFDEAFPEEEAQRAFRRFAGSLAAAQTVLSLDLVAGMPPPKPAAPRR